MLPRHGPTQIRGDAFDFQLPHFQSGPHIHVLFSTVFMHTETLRHILNSTTVLFCIAGIVQARVRPRCEAMQVQLRSEFVSLHVELVDR